jgi:hypothetical protein
LHDPQTDQPWADQEPRWWLPPGEKASRRDDAHHQVEALHRPRNLVATKRDQGCLLLAEGDLVAQPLGVRTLGRNVRTGCAEAADEDAFLRIRLAFEGAADRLPDIAWPCYRLAELLAWGGVRRTRRSNSTRPSSARWAAAPPSGSTSPFCALVEAGLGRPMDGLGTAARPFPAEPFGPALAWRLRLR